MPTISIALSRVCSNCRHVTKWHTALVLGLMATQCILIGYSATRHSPTSLEPAFLASGISHWALGNFELYRVNPPLPRMLAAVPVLVAGCETDWSSFSDRPGSRAEFSVGEDFVRANGDRSMQLIIYARWACVPFFVVGSYFAYRWAKDLYGSAAGLVTLVLWTFEPNLLAHAELVTPDSACTSLGLTAGYTFWRWLKSPSWQNAVIAGFCLGLAELSKTSWIFLFFLWPALWIVWGCANFGYHEWASSSDSRRAWPPFCHLALILLLPVYLINLCYCFDGVGSRVKTYVFVSALLTGESVSGTPGNRFATGFIGNLPVPLPKQYILGLDAQKRDFEDYPHKSYLRGEWKQGGWWYYYIYGLLVKIPSGVCILLALVSVWRVGHSRRVPLIDEFVLLSIAISLLILVSAHTQFNIHLRYAFPCWGLILVFLGQSSFLLAGRSGVVSTVTYAMLMYGIVSCLSTYPMHLAYFNDFVGGPYAGYKHLSGSSLDWGQNFLILKDLLKKQSVQKCIVLCPPRYDITKIDPFFQLGESSVDGNSPCIISSAFCQLPPLRSPIDGWKTEQGLLAYQQVLPGIWLIKHE